MATRRNLTVIDQPNARPRNKGGGGDTPRNRFKRIAPERVAKAVEAIRFLQKLNNTAVYEVRNSDKDQIIGVLEKELEQLKYVLDNPGKAPPVLVFEDE